MTKVAIECSCGRWRIASDGSQSAIRRLARFASKHEALGHVPHLHRDLQNECTAMLGIAPLNNSIERYPL